MDTDGVSRDFDLLAGDGRDLALGDHADGARDGLVLIVDDGAGQLARHKRAVGLIGAVGKDLVCDAQAQLLACINHLAVGKAKQDNVLVYLGNRLGDGKRQIHVFTSHVVESAVGLAVLEPDTLCRSEGHQRAELILDIRLDLLGRDDHVPAAKAHQIGEARVCADGDACRLGCGNGLFHHQRISCVIATGHIDRGNMRDDLVVEPDGIRAEALAEVAVEIYLVHTEIPSFS